MSAIELAQEAEFDLGSAHVRPALRMFACAGADEALEPRVMQVLVALARKQGDVVSRDELIECCWGGRVVGEDAIQRPVAILRRLSEKSGAFALETIPRVGYRLTVTGLHSSATAPVPSAATHEIVLQRPAVAILPFTNLSDDPTQEYFADGITEDLITALAAWRWFPVIARNSTFVYKGRAVDITQVGTELGARYVLEGSVRRVGDQVRITGQLIETSTAHHIWAQHYNRRLDDVFAVQDEITRAIVGAIEPHLARAEQQRALRKRPESLSAWDLSLQALSQIRRGTIHSLTEAEQLLVRAVAMDCTSCYAQSLLALTRFQGGLLGWADDPTGSFLTTYEAASEAVALDDSDWQAHALLGIATLWCHGAYETAIAEVETAISLNPSAALAYHFAGCVFTFNSQPEAALPKLNAVLQLDPRFQLLPTTLADIGLAHLLVGDCELALSYCDRAIGEQRHHLRAWQRRAAALGCMGRIDEARAALAELLRLQPGFSRPYFHATYPFRDPAHTHVLEKGLRAAGWTA